MTKITIHFLPVRTATLRRTKRDAELTDAEAKSHARRSAHVLARLPKRTARGHARAGSQSILRLKKRTKKPETMPADNNDTQAPISRRMQANVPPSIGDVDGCDPFVRFPCVTGSIEHKLFHFLMSYVPSRFYGTRPWAAYDVLRDSVMPEILTGGAYMSLALYVAAAIVNTLKSPQQQPQFSEEWMLARQATNYRLLRQLLENQHGHPWDWAITCVVVAGYADAMAGQAERGRTHTRAGLDMLQDFRNLQRMRLSSGSIAFKAFLQTGVPTMFPTSAALEAAMHGASQNLRRIQAWTRLKRNARCSGTHCQCHPPDAVGENDATEQTARSNGECRYWAARRLALGPTTAMGRLLAPKSIRLPVSDERLLMASIYALHGILCNLQDVDAAAERFLADVGEMTANSLDEGVDLSVPPRFAMQNCIHIVVACAEKHGLWFYHGPGHPLPALRTWEALEFVEIMMLTGPAKQQKIMDAMRRWLYWESSQPVEVAVATSTTITPQTLLLGDDSELEEFKNEIVSNWKARRASESSTRDIEIDSNTLATSKTEKVKA
ncbi:uncharacterized protein PV07_11108 [Cladophialophora immunda]|uniref:Transcription factor domain-containing protein n=1 Tax=Cladophialophora immunda TaxID=569365 RepID=A0A0D2BWW5_9EURO|nr:uncharacterized protein PV07_11108 [Cladophialophora immunda]KIW22855.1 hypothetical protein PV07_11108 [Cladophialophora immunda]